MGIAVPHLFAVPGNRNAPLQRHKICQPVECRKSEPAGYQLISETFVLPKFPVNFASLRSSDRAAPAICRLQGVGDFMPATSLALEIVGSDPHLVMRITCRQCGTKMLVHVGLTLPSPSANPEPRTVECVRCHRLLLPLMPGPILNGPFAE
jgi:hypothetical protein